MRNTGVRVTMIVAEQGGCRQLPEMQRASARDDLVVAAQGRSESISEFGHRVRRQLAELEGTQGTPAEVVIVGGKRKDSDTMRARGLMIRALAAAMARAGGGQIWLEHHPADRFGMTALADTVAPMVQGSGVKITDADSAPALAQVA